MIAIEKALRPIQPLYTPQSTKGTGPVVDFECRTLDAISIGGTLQWERGGFKYLSGSWEEGSLL